MDEKSAKPAGRNWSKIAWITFAGFLAIFSGTAVFLSGDDPTPTVYHRTDGTFSLNRLDGPSTTPDALRDLLKTYEKFERVRLVCNPQTKFSDWGPILNSGGESGAGDYQIESNGKIFSFELPGCGCCHDLQPLNPLVEVVDLSGSDKPPLDMAMGSDVAILINSSTSCDQGLQAAEGFKGQGKKIMIICDPESESQLPVEEESLFSQEHSRASHLKQIIILTHHKEYGARRLTFTRKRSQFWKDHIQPVIDQIKAIF